MTKTSVSPFLLNPKLEQLILGRKEIALKLAMEISAGTIINDDDPWGYIRINPASTNKFIEKYKKVAATMENGSFIPGCFVHESQAYKISPQNNEPVEDRVITPIGIIFLHGQTEMVKTYLTNWLTEYHLVNDKATGTPAQIPAKEMSVFMSVADANPTAITYLDNPLSTFQGRAKIRILTGVLKGQTGYYVRHKRDRKLVVGMGNMTIAYGGIFKEKFEFFN